MKKIYLIGIGPGGPEYLTIQAINTMKKVDVFFLLEKKGKGRENLLKIRREILERYLNQDKYQVVTAEVPSRKRGKAYKEKVEIWRLEKGKIILNLIKNELKDNQVGAFLIWGDPSLYDGTLEILHHILKQRGVKFEYEVIPGITSIQILAARHKIPLNYIGESIIIVPARKLKEGLPVENTVVLLDSASDFLNVKDEDIEIYWGGYLGTDDEILISGKLKEIAENLMNIRKEAKKKKGWLMDTYILKKRKK